MTDDRSRTPTEERAREDAELGYPPELADRLRTTMTTAVVDVHAPAALYDEVRSRDRRSRWTTHAGLGLAGLAAVAGIALALDAVNSSGTVIDTEPAGRETGGESPSEPPTLTEPTAESTGLDGGDQGADAADDPATSPSEAEAAPARPKTGQVVLTDDLPFPLLALEADDDGLHLLERGPDGYYGPSRTVLSAAALEDLVGPGRVGRLWVRPGSTVNDLQAVLYVEGRSDQQLVTIEAVDPGETVSAFTWEGEAQLAGSVFDMRALAWSPDGATLAYSVLYDDPSLPSGIVVLDVDEDGRPMLAGRVLRDTTRLSDGCARASSISGVLHWADVGEDGFSLWTEDDSSHIESDSAFCVTRWRRNAEGSVERVDSTGERVLYSDDDGQRSTGGSSYVVPTRHGVVHGVGDGLTVRLVPTSAGVVQATANLPTELGRVLRAQLGTVEGDPVVLTVHERGQTVITPAADGTLELAVLLRSSETPGRSGPGPTPSFYSFMLAFDWVD